MRQSLFKKIINSKEEIERKNFLKMQVIKTPNFFRNRMMLTAKTTDEIRKIRGKGKNEGSLIFSRNKI